MSITKRDMASIELVLAIAKQIDDCAFCVAIRYDHQPSFVDMLKFHFSNKHHQRET